MQSHKIAVVGLWHLGSVYSACLAELGHEVIGIDNDVNVITKFCRNETPVAEPGLSDLIKSNRAAGRLSYTTDASCVGQCDVVWLVFDTPVDDNDQVDLSPIYLALRMITPFLRDDVLVMVSSQLPAGESAKMTARIHGLRPDLNFDYVYCPENIRLGEAVKCFFQPERIVVGSNKPAAFDRVKSVFGSLGTNFLKMSVVSAEMSKHALNAFLATSVSFTSDVADVCEKVGADILDVSRSLRSDPRIGERAYLSAGLGFSGGTLGRDLKVLMTIAKEKRITLPVIASVFLKNQSRKNLIVDRLIKHLHDLRSKKVAILGLTYKVGTDTLRRSMALEIVEMLTGRGARVSLHDPKAKRGDILVDAYSAAAGAHAVVLMTPWPEYRQLDFGKLGGMVSAPAIFLDASNFLSDVDVEIKLAGFTYWGIGR